MKIIKIANFAAFDELYKKYEQKKNSDDLKNLLLLFTASEDLETKLSWCSDCRKSQPIIDKAIKDFEHNDQIVLAIIFVGQKEEWKRSSNPFRAHQLHVEAVPTLLSLKNGLRLVEAECADSAKVSHLFSNSI